jgi:hypothetical protein
MQENYNYARIRELRRGERKGERGWNDNLFWRNYSL